MPPRSRDLERTPRALVPANIGQLRMGDLEVLANAAGKKPEELIELLGPSILGEPEELQTNA